MAVECRARDTECTAGGAHTELGSDADHGVHDFFSSLSGCGMPKSCIFFDLHNSFRPLSTVRQLGILAAAQSARCPDTTRLADRSRISMRRPLQVMA
jgi:hypothetical protein